MDATTQKVIEIPQWKKDLIARLRNSQNKSPTTLPLDQQLNSSPQLSLHCETSVTNKSSSVTDASVVSSGCSTSCRNVTCVKTCKMVQERNWVDSKHPLSELEENGSNGYHHKSDDSDSEDLHYGPGIVKKLKNKYLSLALRESNSRPTILHLRKATSLENVLDDDSYNENRHFLSRANGDAKNTIPNRYRNAVRREMKRARSVETISRLDSAPNIVQNNRQSLHEDMLNTGNTYILNKTQDNKYPVENNDLDNKFNNRYINRPKRLQPLMNEKEKPPADFVKQAKKIFEAPEQRTRQPRQTGDVAAKVDSFNNIIVKAKVDAKISRKTQMKNKPVLNDKLNIENRSKVTKTIGNQTKPTQQSNVLNNNGKNNHIKDSDDVTSLPSPSLEISRNEFIKNVENFTKKNGLPETNDSNSIPKVLSPRLKDNSIDLFHQEEGRISLSPDQNYSKRITSPILSPTAVKPASPLLMPVQNIPIRPPSPLVSPTKLKSISDDDIDANNQPINTVINVSSKSAAEIVPEITTTQNHQPAHDINEKKTPPSQPLFIKVNGLSDNNKKPTAKPSKTVPRGPPKFSPPPPPTSKLENEKHHNIVPPSANEIANNLKNSNENISKPVEVVNKNLVAKKNIVRDQPNSVVFIFTHRKGVPDYILNDKSKSPSREPDDDEELIRSVDGPPSPCDVTFINDNILIDGKSCFIRKTKDVKLSISFQDDADIYEYPSESSMILDDSFISSPVNHMVPQLSGTSLANYTPKGTEEFQPGITRSVQQPLVPVKQDINDVEQSNDNDLLLLKEADTPFSSGTNSDILF